MGAAAAGVGIRIFKYLPELKDRVMWRAAAWVSCRGHYKRSKKVDYIDWQEIGEKAIPHGFLDILSESRPLDSLRAQHFLEKALEAGVEEAERKVGSTSRRLFPLLAITPN